MLKMTTNITGVPKCMAKLDAHELGLQFVLTIAVKRSLVILKDKAREILEQEQTNKWPDKDGNFHLMKDGNLWKSLRGYVVKIGKKVVAGEVRSTDPAAIWLEAGTEGHDIPLKDAPNLSWWEAPGVRAASGGHHVSGITETKFMSRAIEECEPLIIKEFENILRRGGYGFTPENVRIFSHIAEDAGFTVSE